MLTLKTFAESKGFTVEQLAQFGVRQGPRGVEIPYFDTDGSERPRVRLRTALAAKDGSTWSDGTAELVPYGLNRPVAWERSFVFVVEGESDCWTLWLTGKPALGLPGATNVKCLRLEHVDGAENVYVVREPGAAGARFPHKVAERLYGLGFPGRVYAIDLEAKDPHELWQRDPATFDERLRATFSTRELIEPQVKKNETAEPTGISSLALVRAKPRIKTRQIVDGLLPAGGIMLLAAKPKVGKSILARNLALAVVRGGLFLDRQCERGSVIYVRLDEPYNLFMDAIDAMGFDGEAAERFHFNDEWPPLDNRIGWLTSWIQKIRPVLVIVDTWIKLANVREIKSYSEVLRAAEPLERLAREHGIAQLWVHHAKTGDSTGGDSVLGGTSLFSACDTSMFLQAYPDGLRSVSTDQRGENMEETPLVMDPKTQLISIAPAKVRLRRAKVEERIVEFLTDHPEQTKAEILEAIDLRKNDVAAGLASLLERSLVEGVGTGTKGDPILYSIRLRSTKSPPRDPENGNPGPTISKNGTYHSENRDLPFSGSGPSISEIGTRNSGGSEPVVFGAHAGGSRVRALRAVTPTYAPASNITNSLETNSLQTTAPLTGNIAPAELEPSGQQIVSPTPGGLLGSRLSPERGLDSSPRALGRGGAA